ncbi:MAG: NIL domain-containing protein, partial [Actinobacteria bacterium]|nr:NIL domain-containing protein [Actinomycetota bacterium]
MNSARVKMTFPEHLIKQPVIARLVREFDVMPNIRQAKIEEKVGWVVLELG